MTRVRLPDDVLASMRGSLASVGDETLTAVLAEVPAFAELSREPVGPRIERAVRRTLTEFVEVVADGADLDDSRGLAPILRHAYDMGRGEAQGGRSPEALLAAYRVGARTAWRRWSGLALTRGLPGDEVARFAEMMFDYMDRVSAAGVSGHSDEQATSGLARARRREHLTRMLLGRRSDRDVTESANRAEWVAPPTMCAVAVPTGLESAMTVRDHRTLVVPDDLVSSARRSTTVVLVPDVAAGSRSAFVASLGVSRCIVGPSTPWRDVDRSLRRVLRTLDLASEPDGVVDTDERLPELVLSADVEALTDLRVRALRPLDGLSAAATDKLVDTLRAWLLHHGRRENIAAELFVHPSTVRYRVGQLRELFGERLTDPTAILELTLALGASDPHSSVGRPATAVPR